MNGVLQGTDSRADDGSAQVTRGSLALGASVLFTAGGGLVFWLLAARLEAAAVVGEAQALFQLLAFVNYVANLGIPVAIARFVGPAQSGLANWLLRLRIWLAMASIAAVMLMVGGAELLDPLWSYGYGVGAAVFLPLGVGMAIAVVVESRLMTLRLWGGVVARSASAAILRLPLVALFAFDVVGTDRSFWLFVVASAPIALSGYVAAGYVRWGPDKISRSQRITHRDQTAQGVMRFAGVNWLGLLATQGPVFAVPVVVAFSVSSAANAPFFVAWSFGSIAFLVPQVVGQVTLSESSQEGDAVKKLSHALRLALVATCSAAILAQFGSGMLAKIYGPAYDDLAIYVPILVASSIAWSYTSLALTAARVENKSTELLALSGVFLVTTLIPTLVFVPKYGAEAAVWSWLTGNAVAALFAAYLHFRWSLGTEQPAE